MLPWATARRLIGQIKSNAAPAELSPQYLAESVLGPFAGLPLPAQAGIVASIRRRDRGRAKDLEFGPGFAGLLRTLWRLKLWLKPHARRWGSLLKAISVAVDAVCFASRRLPGHLRQTTQRTWFRLAGGIGRTRSLGAILYHAGLEEADLAVSFARALPQEPPYRSYWDELSRNRTIAKLIGIDLLPGRDGFWFIESNVNPALVEERSILYRTDPLIETMIATAREGGYRRLIYLDNHADGIDPAFAGRLTAEAAATGLELQIHNMLNVPTDAFARSYGLTDDGASNVLVVQPRAYRSCLDRILTFKTFSYAVLEEFKSEHDEPDLLLPAWGRRPVLEAAGDDESFPNLVYKQPNLDQGQGLVFVKARDQGHALSLASSIPSAIKKTTLKDRLAGLAADPDALWQSYVVPRFAEERRPYVVRAHVLLSPRGPQFLSAHRVVSRINVPRRLDFGIVADARPYLVNRSFGGTYARVPTDEERLVRQAALAVCRGLAQAVERAFVTHGS